MVYLDFDISYEGLINGLAHLAKLMNCLNLPKYDLPANRYSYALDKNAMDAYSLCCAFLQSPYTESLW